MNYKKMLSVRVFLIQFAQSCICTVYILELFCILVYVLYTSGHHRPLLYLCKIFDNFHFEFHIRQHQHNVRRCPWIPPDIDNDKIRPNWYTCHQSKVDHFHCTRQRPNIRTFSDQVSFQADIYSCNKLLELQYEQLCLEQLLFYFSATDCIDENIYYTFDHKHW